MPLRATPNVVVQVLMPLSAVHGFTCIIGDGIALDMVRTARCVVLSSSMVANIPALWVHFVAD